MFQTFTGSSRKRQVNLSGRPTNTNPFGSSPFGASHNTLLGAQQDREKRQKDREKLESAKKIQRTWRGYQSRRNLKAEWRTSFDTVEGIDFETADASILSSSRPYGSETEAFAQLRLLLRFAQHRNSKDVLRIAVFANRQAQTPYSNNAEWIFAYMSLQKLIISTLQIRSMTEKSSKTWQILLKCLAWNVEQIPEQTSKHARQLYGILAEYLDENLKTGRQFDLEPFLICLLKPLQTGLPSSTLSYEAFSCRILTLTSLAERAESLKWLGVVTDGVNYKVMARTLVDTLDSPSYHNYSELQNIKRRGNLLGFLIYFHKSMIEGQTNYSYATDKDYLHVVSALITSLVPSVQIPSEDDDEEENSIGIEDVIRNVPFVKSQVSSLVSKANVSLILGSGNRGDSNITAFSQRDESAKQLANFSLTLLKFFPSKSDDIRVSLYLGSGADPSNPSVSVPALKYFWQSAQATSVFASILQNTDTAVPLLQARKSLSSAQGNVDVPGGTFSLDSVQSDWRVLLIFFELYLFALKIMDDEEFFYTQSVTKINKVETWASQNALPLEDVALFTLFLKNLGFSLYFNAAKISTVEKSKDRTTGSLSGYFGLPSNDDALEDKTDAAYVAGLNGITVEYVKGLVTGLLRALYERDSRRPFLPKGHWLMTSKFDMESFIPAVVKEEENRNEMEEDDEPLEMDPIPNLIGQNHAHRLRAAERLKHQQRKLARQRQLQAVAPRLEILQNMPFFIPFETRVQIFREFIALDKVCLITQS
jgi:ubiquitin-protein ligase E3 C